MVEVHNPSGLPEVTKIAKIEEPYILAQIITKAEFLATSSSYASTSAA